MFRRMRWTALAVLAAVAAVLATAGTAGAYSTDPAYKAVDFATGFANNGPNNVGPVGLAWDATNHLYVMDYDNGILYRFDSTGGVADAAHQVTVGSSPWGHNNAAGIAFSKSGRLYVAVQGWSRVDEVNLSNGQIVRSLGYAHCATGIATDPTNGDLLVSDPCPGAAMRFHNPDGASPSPSYNLNPYWADGVTFAPDGSVWTTYGGSTLVHLDSTGPHYLAGISTLDGTAVSSAGDGSVFANTNNGQVVKYDPSTHTQTTIFTGGSRGDFSTVGPDGCLYITQTDRIVKITNADGTCSWSPTTALPTITLAPTTQTHHVGETATITATLANATHPAGTSLTVTVTGANPQTTTATVGADGTAAIDLTATAQGDDHVNVSATVDGQDVSSNVADITWEAPLDTTPPVIVPTIDGPAGDNGWYTGDTKVSWSVSDPETGVASSTGCDTVTLSGYHSGETITCSATNGIGMENQVSVTIKIDDTAPTVTPTVAGTLGSDGWYVSPVTIAWATADDESGIASTSGCDTVTYSADTASVTSTCTAVDGAGLSATGSQTVKIDQTAPKVTYTGDAGSYDIDQTVAIACSSSDALSGVVSDTCAGVSGPAWTFGLGSHTYSATATDDAGNVGSGSTTFTVVVTPSGLCNLVERWTADAGVANSLCVKLAHGSYGAFRNEVSAQRGKKISAAHADELILLSKGL